MSPRDRIFPARLRQSKEAAGYTWRQLAQVSGYASTYLYELNSGKRHPSLGCAKALADTLGVDPAWLVGWK